MSFYKGTSSFDNYGTEQMNKVFIDLISILMIFEGVIISLDYFLESKLIVNILIALWSIMTCIISRVIYWKDNKSYLLRWVASGCSGIAIALWMISTNNILIFLFMMILAFSIIVYHDKKFAYSCLMFIMSVSVISAIINNLNGNYSINDTILIIGANALASFIVLIITNSFDKISKEYKGIIEEKTEKQQQQLELVRSLYQGIEISAQEIVNQADKLNKEMGSVDESVSNIAISNTETATSLQTLSQLSIDIQILIQNFSTSIETVVNNVNGSVNASKKGLNVMTQLLDNSNEVVEGSNKVADDMKYFSKQIETIKDITSSITEIAENTNLLALNASIEAARAGESGKGFAIVAEEISTLADDTQLSAQQIANILDEFVVSIQNMTDVISCNVKTVEAQSKLMNETNMCFENISSDLNSTRATTENLKEMYEDLNTANTKIVNHIGNLSRVTEEVSEQTKNTSRLAKDSYSKTKVITSEIHDLLSNF